MNPIAAPPGSTVQLRPMVVSDLQAVMKNERNTYAVPWSEQNFRGCLCSGYYCRVIDYRSMPVGHGVLQIDTGNASLLNVSVIPDYQRLGIGTILLRQLLTIARNQHADTALLEVRSTNTAARRLYERLGFNEVGVHKAYYQDRNGYKDALIMMMDIGSADWSGVG